jgi:acetyltransferase-like isoleucine patch superfamily enzyme
MTSRFSVPRLAHAALSLPCRLRAALYARRLRDICDADNTASFGESTIIHNPYDRAAVKIGPQCLFLGEINLVREGASVEVGEWTFVGPGAKLWSIESISIGSRVQISHGVHVFDNNSHSLSAADRSRSFQNVQITGFSEGEPVACSPVRIEDWI